MTSEPSVATLDKVLIAAEKLFAENGYDGTTLRQITQAANVNLAAVNYHHGDKESLYLEIIRRHLQPLNRERLLRLAEAERAADPGPVPVATLIEIMAGPLFALGANNGAPAARLVGRALLEPLPFMEPLLAAELEPALARFGQALRRHTPALSPEEFLWRYSMIVGAAHHSLATMHRMKGLTRGICRDHDPAAALRTLVHLAGHAFTSAR